MRITSVQQNNYKPQFKNNSRHILDNRGKLLYRTTTYFFREDFNWQKFIKMLGEKYKDAPKVNMICHACSSGEEPFSLVMGIENLLGNLSQKFFPIEARDIDAKNIEMAKKSGFEGVYGGQLLEIKRNTNHNVAKYFDVRRSSKYDSIVSFNLNPKNTLRDKVNFEQADIFKDVETMPKSNTVLFFRNVWPYLSVFERDKLAKKLYNNFDESSLVVVGSFDYASDIHWILTDNGFVETDVDYVYSKPLKS